MTSPFAAALAKRGNPYHDAKGRFSATQGGSASPKGDAARRASKKALVASAEERDDAPKLHAKAAEAHMAARDESRTLGNKDAAEHHDFASFYHDSRAGGASHTQAVEEAKGGAPAHVSHPSETPMQAARGPVTPGLPASHAMGIPHPSQMPHLFKPGSSATVEAHEMHDLVAHGNLQAFHQYKPKTPEGRTYQKHVANDLEMTLPEAAKEHMTQAPAPKATTSGHTEAGGHGAPFSTGGSPGEAGDRARAASAKAETDSKTDRNIYRHFEAINAHYDAQQEAKKNGDAASAAHHEQAIQYHIEHTHDKPILPKALTEGEYIHNAGREKAWKEQQAAGPPKNTWRRNADGAGSPHLAKLPALPNVGDAGGMLDTVSPVDRGEMIAQLRAASHPDPAQAMHNFRNQPTAGGDSLLRQLYRQKIGDAMRPYVMDTKYPWLYDENGRKKEKL